MRCSSLLLCALLSSVSAGGAFAQSSTTLTVSKVQDFKQTSPAAPVQVTNPFAFTASVQASGYAIGSATVTPPNGSAISLASVSPTLFSFTSSPFATAQSLNTAFLSGGYLFSVTPTATGVSPVNEAATMPAPDKYPAAPTLTNVDSDWLAGALQFDASQSFTVSWAAPDASVTDVRIVVTDPSGAIAFNTTLAANATQVALPAKFQPGIVYSARLTFGATILTGSSGNTTSKGGFVSATNFSLNPVSGPPGVITPSTFTLVQGQPMAYQLVANTNAIYSIDQATLDAVGLKFDPATGIIYGTPTQSGRFQPQFTIQNVAGVNGGTLTADALAASSGPKFANATSATGRVGVPFTFQIVTTGASPSATFSATNLPAGLTIDAATGRISGTTNSAGSTDVKITVMDASGTTTSALQLTFVADPIVPVITSPKRVTLYPGQLFSYKITAAFGANRADEPAFTVIGTLPTGLNFDPKTGVISGVFGGQLQRDNSAPDYKFLNDSPLVQLAGTNTHGTGTSPLVFLAAPTGTVNLSTRMFVGTNDDVLIGGFIITGNAPENLLVRGIGPSLPVSGAVQDPILELHTGATTIATDDDWQDDATQAQAIKDAGVAPVDSRESALVGTFQPANFTAVVRGKNGMTGVGLVELYDLGTQTQDTSQHAKLAQISTRGTVHTGDEVMIGGFIVQGVATKVLLRGIGPELSGQGVAGALQDTIIELHGGDGTVIASNDDWKATQQSEIQASGVPPTDDRESALIATLNPGNYTAVLRGKNDTTGVALVEVYNLQ